MNYFDFFDFKMAPVIDKTRVAKKYFDLQKQYHPDFYTQATEAEKEEALDISSQINKAFKIFKRISKRNRERYRHRIRFTNS